MTQLYKSFCDRIKGATHSIRITAYNTVAYPDLLRRPVPLDEFIVDSEKGLWGPVDYKVYIENAIIAGWRFTPFPSCCGLLISTESYVSYEHRGNGIGTVLNELRQQLAKAYGYSMLICTDNIVNNAQRRILEKNGWSDVKTFLNTRTNNTLAISVCEVA